MQHGRANEARGQLAQLSRKNIYLLPNSFNYATAVWLTSSFIIVFTAWKTCNLRKLKRLVECNTQHCNFTQAKTRVLLINGVQLVYLLKGLCVFRPAADSVNIKILNAGAWSRSSEKVFVSLPTELEDLIPEVEDFYKKNHSGRKLHWHHLMSNGIVSRSRRLFVFVL